MNDFKILAASVECGLTTDAVNLVTDINHPDYSDPLVIAIRVKRGTGIEWVREEFGGLEPVKL